MDARLAVRFALAVVLEFVYVAGRTWILDQWDDGNTREFLWSAWRVPFVVLYYLLLPPFLFAGEKRRGMPLHPLLLAALALAFVQIPVMPYDGDFPEQAVLAVTTPIVGLREEIFYRGILQGSLERVLGPVPSILVASVLFTTFHYGAQPLTIVTVTGIFGFGVIFGAIYQRTRNLWLLAALHAFVDVLYAFSPRLDIEWGLAVLCNGLAFICALSWWRVDADRR
jgi:membrane protease YdiL (CAAX protease family)